MTKFLYVVVYLSLPDEALAVQESDGESDSICLQLSGVVDPTLSPIWATVVTESDTAMCKTALII